MMFVVRAGAIFKTRGGAVVAILHDEGLGQVLRRTECGGFIEGRTWYWSDDGTLSGFSPRHPLTLVKEIRP